MPLLRGGVLVQFVYVNHKWLQAARDGPVDVFGQHREQPASPDLDDVGLLVALRRRVHVLPEHLRPQHGVVRVHAGHRFR